jgi:hypothetical protein
VPPEWQSEAPFHPSLLPRFTPQGPVTDGTDATERAIIAANDAAQRQFSDAPFRRAGGKAIFDGEYWVWRSRVARGKGDLEATVRLKPDGSVRDVEVILLNSEVGANLPFRP